MGMFIKKPVTVRAVYWNGADSEDELIENNGNEGWLREGIDAGAIAVMSGRLSVDTPEGVMHTNDPCYIVKGVAGEIYPVKKEIFEATYEPVF